jgi:hypothetical protein
VVNHPKIIIKHLNQIKIIHKLFCISSRSMSDHTFFVKWMLLNASLDNVISQIKQSKSLTYKVSIGLCYQMEKKEFGRIINTIICAKKCLFGKITTAQNWFMELKNLFGIFNFLGWAGAK